MPSRAGLVKTLVLVMLVSWLASGTASADRTLKSTDHEPLGGTRTRFIKDIFFAAVEKESNGRLKIEDHWNGEIAGSYDALRVIGTGGGADMGVIVPEYAPDQLPLQLIFKGFPAGPVGERQIAFFRRAYADIPEFQEELKNANVVGLLLITGYPAAFFSVAPLNDLGDVKGRKFRTASFWHQGFLRNAGAVPVAMPWGEGVFTALKTGELDGLVVNLDSGYDVKAHEAAKNISVSRELWLGHIYILAMNRQVWDGLAQEDREAIQRAAETAYAAMARYLDAGFDSLSAELTGGGAEIRLLDEKELADWRSAAKFEQLQTDWAREQESRGLTKAGPVLEKTRALIAEFTK